MVWTMRAVFRNLVRAGVLVRLRSWLSAVPPPLLLLPDAGGFAKDTDDSDILDLGEKQTQVQGRGGNQKVSCRQDFLETNCLQRK